jgi:hypothetical protein
MKVAAHNNQLLMYFGGGLANGQGRKPLEKWWMMKMWWK